jgi:hypothetical protein
MVKAALPYPVRVDRVQVGLDALPSRGGRLCSPLTGGRLVVALCSSWVLA